MQVSTGSWEVVSQRTLGALGPDVVWFPQDWHRLGSRTEAYGWDAFCFRFRPSWGILSSPVY